MKKAVTLFGELRIAEITAIFACFLNEIMLLGSDFNSVLYPPTEYQLALQSVGLPPFARCVVIE